MGTRRQDPAPAIIAWAGARLRATRRDDGFFLLESIVAIAIITIIMAALTAFFTDSVHTSDLNRAKQAAVQVADAAVDSLRAIPATDLATGRDTSDVNAQYTAAVAASSPVVAWLSSSTMKLSTDDSPGVAAVVPTSPTITTINNTKYSVNEYVGECAAPIGDAASCTTANLTAMATNRNAYVSYARGVVAVEWSDSRCSRGTCTYVTATLITESISDPTFNLNQSPTTPSPIAVSPGNQTSVVGDVISGVQLTMKSGTGVPTATWTTASTLPAGIVLNPDGTFSGSPTTATSALTITATLHDAFLRTSSVSFTWTVLAAVTAAAPSAQAAAMGTAISPLTLSATGGNGAPYTWTDPGTTLPPGLVISTVSNQGRITGTPTAAGIYAVSVTVKDSGGHTATVSWTWTVGYPPLVVANPGTRTSTKGAATTLQLTAAGGSGTATWTSGPLPAGLTLSASGLISGTPTATGTTSVTVTATDTTANATGSQTFTWTVVAAPTITAPAAQSTTLGSTVNLQLTTTCSNSPCSYALTNGPSGLSISASGLVSGSPGNTGTFSSAKVTVTDAANVSTTSAAFTWTVYPALVATNPGSKTSTKSAATSLQLTASGGSGSVTWTSSTLPAGLTLNSSGLISGTPTTLGTTSVTVTATDSTANAVAVQTISWSVVAAPTVTAPSAQTTTVGGTVSLQLATTCPNSPCSYTLSNGPGGLTVSASGLVTGSPAATGTFATAKVTVTDAANVSASSSTFAWTVNAAATWNTVGTQTTYVNTPASLNTALLVSGGTAPYTYSASGLPNWLSINASTGMITGTAPATKAVTSSITVTAKDAANVSVTSAAFKWIVTDLRLAIPDQWTNPGAAVTPMDIDTYLSGGSTPYTSPYTVNVGSLPTGITYNTSTHAFGGTAPATRTTALMSVSVTDSQGATVTDTFTWYVSSLRLTLGDQLTAPNTAVSLDVDSYLSGGTPLAVGASGQPGWLAYSASTHVFSGTAPASANPVSIVITVQENSTFTFTKTITWYVSTLKWTGVSSTATISSTTTTWADMSTFDSGGTAPYTYRATGLPSNVSINPGTGLMTATGATVKATYLVTVTVTDVTGASVTTSTITVTVN